MSYTYNKAPKDRDLSKIIRASIVKDIRRNGLSLKEFANEIGLSEGTLENKLKPAMPTSDITMSEFIHIIDLIGDYAALEYIAKRYGYTLLKPKTSKEDLTTTTLTIKTLNIEEMNGALAKVVKEAVRDGVLDDDEKKEISGIVYQLRKVAAELEESLR